MAKIRPCNVSLIFILLSINSVLAMHVNYVRQLPENALSKTMKDSFYNFGDYLLTGVYDLQVKSLDPLAISSISVKEHTSDVQLEIFCDEVILSGLSSFQLEEADVNLPAMSMKLLIRFPLMIMKGQYVVEGLVKKVFPVSGYGPFTVEMYNATATASADLEFGLRGRLEISNFNLKYNFRRKRIRQKFQKLNGRGPLSEMANRVMRKLGLHLFEETGSLLEIKVGDAVRKKALQTLRRVRVNGPVLRSLRQMEEEEEEEETDTMLANDYVDEVLHNVHLNLENLNLDPYSLPDYGILKEGKLYGLSSLKRDGDAIVTVGEDNEIILEVILQLSQLKAEYIWLKLSTDDKSHKVQIYTENATILLKLLANDEPEARLKLHEFKILKFGRTNVDLQDTGPLGWIFSGIINFSINNFKTSLANVIEGPIKEILQYNLDSVDFTV